MLINTKFLGSFDIEEKDIINFQNGLPGFNELNKFVLLPIEENTALHYIQSVEDEKICFIVVNPFTVFEDYEIDISEETIAGLNIGSADDISLYSILTIPENIQEITVNLLAPIIINNLNNRAAQEILNDDRYSIKHKLYRGE